MSVWKLEDIYKSQDDENLKCDLSYLDGLIEEFQREYFENISINNIKASVVAYEKIAELLKKISVYSFLYSETRLDDEKATAFSQSLSEQLSVFYSKIVFYTVSIPSIDYAMLSAEFEIDDGLKKYKSWFDNCYRYKKHFLSIPEEKILVQKSITSRDSWVRLHSEILAKMQVTFDGEEKNLAEITEIASHSSDANARKDASCAIGAKLKELSFYITHIYNNIILDCAIENKMKSYEMPESFRHVDNDVDQQSVDFLTQAVVQNFSKTSHKYYKIKAKILGKSRLEYWDRNAPVKLSGILDQDISYNDSCALVLDVFKEFSSKFHDVAHDFIHKNWIDVYPKKGKASGAFSCSCSTDIHPYIMLNFLGKIRDVSTLAHELGHGIHQTLSAENGVLLAETPITISEVASLFAEKLLFEKMFAEAKNDREKIDLLCCRLDDTINTVMRQIAFFEFERKCHAARENKELSADEISQIWLEMQKKCCGDFVNIDENVEYYWCYISHFFQSPFYVYAYAFGEIFVGALYKSYKKNGEDFVEKYTKMLANGGIDRYDFAASKFALDPTTQEFWLSGIEEIENQIACLEVMCDAAIL